MVSLSSAVKDSALHVGHPGNFGGDSNALQDCQVLLLHRTDTDPESDLLWPGFRLKPQLYLEQGPLAVHAISQRLYCF